MTEKWIITIHNSTDVEGATHIFSFTGTEEQAKEKLKMLVEQDSNNPDYRDTFDHNNFDTKGSVEKCKDGKRLHAYAQFVERIIDYTAIRVDNLEEL